MTQNQCQAFQFSGFALSTIAVPLLIGQLTIPVIGSASSNDTDSVSIDCSGTTNNVESTICNDPDLVTLDRKMADLYRAHIASLSDLQKLICQEPHLARDDKSMADLYHRIMMGPLSQDRKKAIREEQLRWLVLRSTQCAAITQTDCLDNFYQERINALKEPASQSR